MRLVEQRAVTKYSQFPTNNSYTRLDRQISLSLVLLQTEHTTNGDKSKESFVFNRTCLCCPQGQPGDEGLQPRSQGQTSSRQCRTVVAQLNSPILFPLHHTIPAPIRFQATHYMLLACHTTAHNVTISFMQLFHVDWN